MKKTLIPIALLAAGFAPIQAQISLVNPVPQSVQTEGALTDAPKAWAVKYSAAVASLPAAAALKASGIATDARAPFTLSLSLASEKGGKKAAAALKGHAEGYVLTITDKGASIVGADERGLFYGVQTLLSSMKEGKLEKAVVTDYPDVSWRGTVEGFYGQPWSHTDRLEQLDFYGRNKMNVYIYGPKDDPYHRDHWRVPYPEKEAKQLSELVERAKQNEVSFYWAIHPGVDIKWTTEDRDALVSKLEQMYALGVRAFAVFFDDIWGEGTRADKQAELLNYVDNNFIQKKHDVAPLIMCPTEYNRSWANDEKGYLRTLGSQMNQGIEIMWTGNTVVHCIERPDLEWVNSRIARKAYIWWNYPVSDFVRDRMLLGPVYGNGLDIADAVSGFVSNPMQYAEASKVALSPIADYTWNMKAYDSEASWLKGTADLLPENADALRTFARSNSDLGPNGHGFRREEMPELKAVNDRFKAGQFAPQDMLTVIQEAQNLGVSADILLADKTNPRLIAELRPWLLQAKNVSGYSLAVANLYGLANNPNAPESAFKAYYAQARSIQEQMYNLENDPAALHPYQTGTKLAEKELLPALRALYSQAIKTYNKNHGTAFDATAEYNPFSIVSDVPQLAQLPVTVRGGEVNITPSLEVIKWAAGASLTLQSDREMTLRGLDFDLGKTGTAPLFRLEALVGGTWTEVSLLHYQPNETTVHTGNELGGMRASALRLTNVSGAEQEVYFKRFKLVKD